MFRETSGTQKTMSSDSPQSANDALASETVQVDRKVFFLDLKENQRGRFVKITEDVGGRRDTIMVPASAFEDFISALERLFEFEQSL